jgi:outer membrane protein TolC
MADDAGMRTSCATVVCLLACLLGSVATEFVSAQEPCKPILPEQKCLAIRSPSQMRQAHLPPVDVPTIVKGLDQEQERLPTYPMTLDDAIRIALDNSEVIRVLGGTSGRTIYDPAIANTQIDRARARFDPNLALQNRFNNNRIPTAELDGAAPSGVSIDGDRVHDYDMSLGVSKTNQMGGNLGFDVRTNPTRVDTTDPFLLNPQSRSTVDFRATQPLLQGAGRRANLTPIVLARIDTERSFYSLKLSVQRLVQSVVDAYWSLVLARTELWIRQQQTARSGWAAELAKAKRETGNIERAEFSQALSSWYTFRAAQVSAEAAVLQREQALRDILGLEPFDGLEIIAVTPPAEQRIAVDWHYAVQLAEQNRCDLIELKLVVESDERQLQLARNTALPRVDATARYGFNGLEGRTQTGDYLVGRAGDFPGWQLGVDVSMPLGLREARADLRRLDLVLARDRANLHNGLRQAANALARSYRNLAQYYEEYLETKRASTAAIINVEAQKARWDLGGIGANRMGQTAYLNYLQAITNWGTTKSAEAQSLLRYNSELAAFELEMGTILETHGIAFYEEGFRSIGPAGRLAHDHCYPRATPLGENADRYRGGTEPSENLFKVDSPGELVDPRGR